MICLQHSIQSNPTHLRYTNSPNTIQQIRAGPRWRCNKAGHRGWVHSTSVVFVVVATCGGRKVTEWGMVYVVNLLCMCSLSRNHTLAAPMSSSSRMVPDPSSASFQAPHASSLPSPRCHASLSFWINKFRPSVPSLHHVMEVVHHEDVL